MNFKLFIALFALVGAACAVPARSPNSFQKDHSKCSSIENLHNEVGKTYSYAYTAKNDLELNNGEKTSVIIKSIIDVTPIGGCEQLMHMREVRIQGPAEAEQLARRLERSPIWFTQDNRRIREVGHSADEDHLTLNLKRAILSAMQVSSLEDARVQEKDIYGIAETEYQKTSGSKFEVHLIKQKNLDESSQRRHPIANLLWNAQEKQQNKQEQQVPNDLTCKVTVDLNERIIRKLSCVERAHVAPLIGSRLATQVYSEIQLQHQQTRNSRHQTPSSLEEYVHESIEFSKPTDLYKQYAGPEQQQKLAQVAIRLLEQIREKQANSESIELVNQLAEKIARMNSRTIEQVSKTFDSNKQQKFTSTEQRVQQLFVDLVAQSGNQEALKFMFEQALKSESDVRRNYWLLQLSEVREASIQSVQQLIKILRSREHQLPRQALLSIAKIIGQSNELRTQTETYANAVDAIAELMHERNADKRLRIAAAQALKSIELTHSAQQQLSKIATASSEDTELRVAAIRTLAAHDELTPKVADQLFQLFERNSEPTEIRIYAFRALIKNEQQVEKVLRFLSQESNEQVGFYAGSYLKNMKHNHRQIKSTHVQQLIERWAAQIPKHLESNGEKKTARHLNMRQNFDILDAELEFDADLIYDEQERLSAIRAKVFMDKHYQQGDDFELYVRQRGFDRLAERMVEQFDKFAFQQMIAQVYDLVRSGRSQHVVEQINKLLREFAFDSQMKASIELAVNGKPIVSISTEDLAELVIDSKKNVYQMLQEVAFTAQVATQHLLFRKQQLIPTVSGIALETTQQANWISDLHIGQGKFEPSFAAQIQISAGFQLLRSARLTYKAHAQSNLSFRTHIEKDQHGYPTKFTIYMDKQRMTLLRFKSELEFTAIDGQTKSIEQAEQQTKQCFDSLRNAFGATACFEYKQSKKTFAVSDVHIYIEKETAEMGWEVRFRAPEHQHPFQLMSNRQASNKYNSNEPFVYLISIATPGSRIQREHTMEARFENSESGAMQAKFRLISNKHRFTAEASFENKQNKRVHVQFALNEKKAQFQASVERKDNMYVPTIRIQLPGQKEYTYTGELESKQQGKKSVLRVQLKDDKTKETVFNYYVIRSGRLFARSSAEKFTFSVDAQLQSPQKGQQFRYTGHVIVDDNSVEHEQQYSHRWTPNSVAKVYRFVVKTMRNGNLFDGEMTKYTGQVEYQLPYHGAELRWNMNGQVLKTQKPHLETEISFFTSQADRKEKQRVLYVQQTTSVQQTYDEYKVHANLIAQSDKLNFNHELQLQAAVSHQLQKQPKVTFEFAFGQRNQRPVVKAAFELNTQSQLLYINGKLQTKFDDTERIYGLQHHMQRTQDSKIQATTKLEWNEKTVELKHTIKVQPQHFEIEGQVRIPQKGIEWSHEHALRFSAKNFDLKSIVRDRKQVRSEVRVQLFREQPSSIYIDNQYMNLKAESNSKLTQLHFNGKNFNFEHSTRFDIKPDQIFEVISKTTRNSVLLVDVRGKMNKAQIVFSAEAGKQKAAGTYDRQAKKLIITIKHDQLFDNHRHQIQIAANHYRGLTIDAKVDRDQALWGKFRAVFDQETQLKLSIGDLQAKVESQNHYRQWLASVNYAPWQLQQQIKVNVQPSTIEASVKSTSNKQLPITFTAKLSTTQDSKIIFDNTHFKVNAEASWQQLQAKLYFADVKHNKFSHKTSIRIEQNQRAVEFESLHTERNEEVFNHQGKIFFQRGNDKQTQLKLKTRYYQVQLTANLPQQIQWTVIDKVTGERVQSASFEARKQLDNQQVQIKIEQGQKQTYMFEAKHNKQQKTVEMFAEKKEHTGYKRVQRVEAAYKHNEKFEFNVQSSTDTKPMNKQIQLSLYRHPQQKQWQAEMKAGDVAFDLKLKNHEEKGFEAKLQFPMLSNKYAHELEAVYSSQRRQARLTFKQEVNQQTKYDLRAEAKFDQGFDITFNSYNKTRFEMHMQASEQGYLNGFLKNHQFDISLNSKWQQQTRREWFPKMFELQSHAKKDQKQIARAEIQYKQQQPFDAKLSLYENELKLTRDAFTGVFKLKANLPRKAITANVELNHSQDIEAQLYIKGATVAAFSFSSKKRNLHLTVMDHDLSAKLARSNDQQQLEVTYQVLHLKHRTEFFVSHFSDERKLIIKLDSKSDDQTYVDLDAQIAFSSQKKQFAAKLQVLNHWAVFEADKQHIRISHEYLKPGSVNTTTFYFQAVHQQKQNLLAFKMNLLNKYKAEAEVVFDSREDNRLQIRYDYQQYAARINIVYKKNEQKVEYLIATYYQEKQNYGISGHYKMNYREMDIVFKAATTYQKVNFDLKSDGKATKLTAELDDQKYIQLKHRTVISLFNSQKPFELKTKTEAGSNFNVEIETNNWNNAKTDSKIVYSVFGFFGNFKFDYQPNKQATFEHECHRPRYIGGDYVLKAKMNLDDYQPLKGELTFTRKTTTKVTMETEPTKINGERAQRVKIVAVNSEQQNPIFQFETTYSADLMRAKRAGRLQGRLQSKLQLSNGKRMTLNYLWKNDNQFIHELQAVYEQNTYGYAIKYAYQKGEVQVTLPKNRKFVIQVNQKQEKEIEMNIYPNYENEPSNKYTTTIKYNVEQQRNKVKIHSYITVKHTSMRRPINFEMTASVGDDATPFEFKFAVESERSAYFYVKVQQKPHYKLDFQLHQSEKKHLHLTSEWKLQMPSEHIQGLYWSYNNNFKQAIKGGYRFYAKFEQHRYELDLKSINVFNVEFRQKSSTEYQFTVQPTNGNVQRATYQMNLARGEARLQTVDRSGKKRDYNGQVSYDKKNGLHLKVTDNTKTAAQVVIKRDSKNQDENYITVVADIQQQLLNALNLDKVDDVLNQYSKTQQQMKRTAIAVVEDVIFSEQFYTFWTQVARDTYYFVEHLVGKKAILDIIGKEPTKPEDYAKALKKIFDYYGKDFADWVLSKFLPHELRYAANNFYYETKQQLYQQYRNIKENAEQALKRASWMIKSFDDKYDQFRRQKPAEHLRQIFAKLDEMAAKVQRFFDYHATDLLTMIAEYTRDRYTKQRLVRVRDTIPHVSEYVTSFHMTEMSIVNMIDILFGEQSWTSGNYLRWKQGHLEARFFFPKSVQHYFE